jgi:hypothetical protein
LHVDSSTISHKYSKINKEKTLSFLKKINEVKERNISNIINEHDREYLKDLEASLLELKEIIICDITKRENLLLEISEYVTSGLLNNQNIEKNINGISNLSYDKHLGTESSNNNKGNIVNIDTASNYKREIQVDNNLNESTLNVNDNWMANSINQNSNSQMQVDEI